MNGIQEVRGSTPLSSTSHRNAARRRLSTHMKVLLFGANGQVGREIVSAAASQSDLNLKALTRADADLMREDAGADTIRRAEPDLVINAAAWTQVDKAESERAAARRLNSLAPAELAAAALAIGARFIHLSTDYVFPGSQAGEPLTEDAETGPVNVYGATKLEGERLTLKEHPDAIIVRTSWVYSSHGANFVQTMLRLAETKKEVSIVEDQIGGPTPANAIAKACLAVARRSDGAGGLFHFQGAPPASWADFAAAIFAASGKNMKINRIKSQEYETPAQRPLFTVLNCSKIRREYGVEQPDWRRDLPATIEKIVTRGAGC